MSDAKMDIHEIWVMLSGGARPGGSRDAVVWTEPAKNPKAADTRYVLGSDFDEMRRQRDEAVGTLRSVWKDCATHDPRDPPHAPQASTMIAVRDTIETCQGDTE